MATAGKNLSNFDLSSIGDVARLKIGLVVSEWNDEITEGLYQGALDTLIRCGIALDNVIRWNVPGAFELPYGCKKMTESITDLDALIAIGSVIRGETAHFDFVCHGATQGIMNLNLTLKIPVIFCVLTDDTKIQAQARSGGIHGNKGVEAAVAALKMAKLGS